MQKGDSNKKDSLTVDAKKVIQFERPITEDGGVMVEWLASQTGISKRALKEVLIKGAVQLKRVGAVRKRIRRATFELTAGDIVYFNYDPAVLEREPPQPNLLFKCREYSIWYKPAGLLSQGNEWSDHCSILRLAEQQLSLQQAYLVHRLDREATGIMMIAHTRHAAAKLSELWQKNQILKYYKVCVSGKTLAVGEFAQPLDGKTARTRFTLEHYDEAQHCSWLDVSIITGRKHQIRRHFADAGFPVVGEPQYGDKSIRKPHKNGLQLQASVLEFNCPFSKVKKRFEVPVELLIHPEK